MSYRIFIFFSLTLLVLLMGVDLSMGSIQLSIKDIYTAIIDPQSKWHDLLWQLRIPKVIAGLLSGIALSIAGLLLQTLFYNPLASPGILGVTSGASLGIALVVFGVGGSFLSYTRLSGSWLMVFAAFIGSLLVLLVILFAAFKLRDNGSLLIIGIMISSLSSSLIGLWQYFSKPEEMRAYVMWSMGSLQGLTLSQVPILATIVLGCTAISFLLSKSINAILLGEHMALSLGVNIQTTRIRIVLLASLLASSVTAFCGLIGFIGIAIPHFSRILLKTASFQKLFWGCILLGASLLLFCDIVSQLPNDTQLPINILTSIIGAPCIIWILFLQKRR